MTMRAENMDRKTYLKAAEVIEDWDTNAGRFLVAHPSWTFTEFTKTVNGLRSAFHAAFGKMHLAGQHPANYDGARDVEMGVMAHCLYLEVQWDQADTGG